MKPDQETQAFLEKTRAVLDQSVQELDTATVSALRRARAEALESHRRRRSAWGPLGAMAATAATVALAVMLLLNQGPTEPPVALEDMALLTTGEDLEFYRDLEFYSWLADARQTG